MSVWETIGGSEGVSGSISKSGGTSQPVSRQSTLRCTYLGSWNLRAAVRASVCRECITSGILGSVVDTHWCVGMWSVSRGVSVCGSDSLQEHPSVSDLSVDMLGLCRYIGVGISEPQPAERQPNLWQHLSIGVGQQGHPSVSTSVEHRHEIRTSECLEQRESVNECIAPTSDPPTYCSG